MRGESPEIWRNPIAYLAGGALFSLLAGSAYLVTRTLVPEVASGAVEVASAHGPTQFPGITSAAGAPRVEVTAPAAEQVPEVRIRTAPQPAPQLPVDESAPILAPEVKITDRRAEVQALIARTAPPAEPVSPSATPSRPARDLPRLKSSRPTPGPAVSTPALSTPPVAEGPAEDDPATEPQASPLPAPAAPTVPRERNRFRGGLQEPREVHGRSGRLSLYFDADSSTFNRAGERMPLAVEVWVDGVLKLRSSDPEKRDFDLGRLSAGWHEVEVVPHVADLPTQPRRRSVRIEEDGTVSYRVVLRRENGMARISKFTEVN